ncbi:UTRA domain-containing protein [Candidatus Halocynthiibacter alkanivorans]|uniref:UTRA domain-containing protein n=1 Tax=Candidatus Halocynthiibacter alkanivorans TaxID=2267619 RepID=UPI000DF47F8B|nr:UTRA domain-containing protein [Candidatus Halocynthiibacter alkanivorans]
MSVKSKTGYRDVKAIVLKRIQDRVWQPGALLPAEADLAVEFGCARATVNRAMQELSDDGLVERRRKAGTRVKKAPLRQVKFEIPMVRAEVEASGASYRYALVTRNILVAPDWLRARLDLAPEAQVLHLECMHYANSNPFQFEDRWINLAAVPDAEQADFTAISPNEWLVQTVPFTTAEVRFSASAASESLAEFLQTPTGSPLFTAERTTWLNGLPVTNTRLHFASGYSMVAQY